MRVRPSEGGGPSVCQRTSEWRAVEGVCLVGRPFSVFVRLACCQANAMRELAMPEVKRLFINCRSQSIAVAGRLPQ